MSFVDLNQEAMVVHKENNGKLATIGKAKLTDAHDLAILYTPGVAEPCRAIEKEEDLSFELTMRGNCVAVISDGTRVLGLGNIGAAAGIPVQNNPCLGMAIPVDNSVEAHANHGCPVTIHTSSSIQVPTTGLEKLDVQQVISKDILMEASQFMMRSLHM